MAKFLTGNELNTELEKLLEDSRSQIILISPYIKLHDRFISTLKTKLNEYNLKLVIVFGKNEDDLTRSMKIDDFNFFKEFPNIEIRYEKRLHAKYYANETSAILTSMNLYSYSQDNNIEAGVQTKITLLSNLANNLLSNVTGDESLDSQTWNYFSRVIEQSELLFFKEPQFESIYLGFKQKYIKSNIVVDKLSEFFSKNSSLSINKKNTIESTNYNHQISNSFFNDKTGYCIRTGISIPFNIEKPMSYEAYKLWSRFSDPNYPEKYCHYSGEISNGETCISHPILKKYWKKAKTEYDL